MDHIAGEQLGRTAIGDVVWIWGMNESKLYIVGRIKVGWLGTYEEAARQLDNWDLWDAQWHIIAENGTEEPYRRLDITESIGILRFISNTRKDRLQITGGKVNTQQLRTMRQLSPETVDLLEVKWYGEYATPENVLDYVETIEDFTSYTEGQLVQITRRERQRNRQLIQDKKTQFRKANGHLYCEACGFDFTEFYGDEYDYAEAHHKFSISKYTDEGEQTTIENLVLLCANCHRVVHFTSVPLSFNELKQKIQKQRHKKSLLQ